jgi:hypothetical protein
VRHALVECCPQFIADIQIFRLISVQNLECLYGADSIVTVCEGFDYRVQVFYRKQRNGLVKSFFSEVLQATTGSSEGT